MNRVRCAIYTRKSSDEGLDQAFNSLDAQREACEAYIRSQKHEGWTILPALYDDGGASGGNLERTALQHLLAEVDAGRVDMIVVYKIDRLTRSLSDFARLVDRLDAAGASFVSVTQQFNTSTSMGRLTLNVLLSFAQFEREVTAERIRDKIAASKKKGMWMGGRVPLGYDKSDTGLVINATEAELVRLLFETYLRLGCVRKLKFFADKEQLRTKTRTMRDGRIIAGSRFSRGCLYHLLNNPIYIGRIRHKDETFEGLHEAIIPDTLWDEVQIRLSNNAVDRKTRRNAANASPLASKVFDAGGRMLTPSHSRKKGRRYRYYVSTGSDPAWRIPAPELEQVVAQAIAVDRTVQVEARQAGIEASLKMVTSVTIGSDYLDVKLQIKADAEPVQVRTPYTLRRRGVENRITLNTAIARAPDKTLINRILMASGWIDQLKQGRSIAEIAAHENVTPGFVTHQLNFGYLSPNILSAISAGKQRPDACTSQLSKVQIPPTWSDQEQLFLG